MEILRTPDDRFADLTGWGFEPHYTTITDAGSATPIRLHHIDEGPADANPVLCMHGEPSWSYLYRTMVPVLTAAGNRVVCPDLVGFGRSDKPAERSEYTYANHVAWMSDWLVANDLHNITLVCQDWGGLIGLRLVAAFPDRFDRVVAANTFLPTGDGTPSKAFLAWREYSQATPVFDSGRIVSGGTANNPLPDEIIAAYNAPFPDQTYTAGARQFPTLVPISTDDPERAANLAAWEVLGAWTKPFLTAFSDQDAVTAGNDAAFHKRVPGTAGQAHTTIVGGGHFLQEDCGPQLAAVVNEFIAST